MAFDAFLYFPDDKSKVPGETQDEDMKKLGAFELISFSFGAENNINIGSMSSGGGAGKATFKEFNITKKTDTGSCGIFSNLVTGTHFGKAVLELRRSGGAGGKSGATFLKFQFLLVMVQDIEWSGSDGDDVCEESVTFQYGAIRIEYSQQDMKGAMKMTHDSEWSRVKNSAVFKI